MQYWCFSKSERHTVSFANQSFEIMIRMTSRPIAHAHTCYHVKHLPVDLAGDLPSDHSLARGLWTPDRPRIFILHSGPKNASVSYIVPIF